MSYAYDRYLPTGLTWRELFDVAAAPYGVDFWTLEPG